jgi:hypothetical protein
VSSGTRDVCLVAFAATTLFGCRSQQPAPPITLDVPPVASSTGAHDVDRFAELAAGVDFTCGRTPTGHVYCWGSNRDGMFGSDAPPTLWSPTRIPTLEGARAIAAPNVLVRAICAIGQAGRVSCLSRGDAGTAHPIVTIAGATGLAVGPVHVCVSDQTGEIACGVAGFRGAGDAPASGWPYHDVSAFRASWDGWPGTGKIARLIANGDRLCVELAGGRAECVTDGDRAEAPTSIDGVNGVVAWDEGVCGRGASSWKCSPDASDAVAQALVKLAASDEAFVDGSFPKHVCVVTSTGGATCTPLLGEADWGTSPVSATDWPVASVVFGRTHGCLLGRDGTARCWGNAKEGRLGAASGVATTGVRVPGIGHVAELVAQDRDFCARQRDGRVSCWGRQGGTSGDIVEIPGKPSSLGSVWPFCVQLAAGSGWQCRRGGYRRGGWAAPLFPTGARVKRLWPYDGLDLHAVTTAGDVLSWTPPLADPSPATSPVRFTSGGRNGARTVSPDGACVIVDSGEVQCRCDRSDGALPRCVGGRTWFPVEDLRDVRDNVVHMRNGDVCATHPDGTLACGYPPSVTPHGGVNAAALASLGPVNDLGQSTELATGGAGDVRVGGYACAVLASGEVWCWGRVPLAVGMRETTGPVKIESVPMARHVALGKSVGCVIGQDENVYCWGGDGTPSGPADTNVGLTAVSMPADDRH